MRNIECPNLCDTCPIRDNTRGEPIIMGELGYVVAGQVSEDGRSASFEFSDGVPVNMNQRISIIGIAGQDRPVEFSFDTPGAKWDDGSVERAFEECDGPTVDRSGLLGLIRRRLACTALKNLAP